MRRRTSSWRPQRRRQPPLPTRRRRSTPSSRANRIRGIHPLPKTNATVARVLEENGVRTLEDLALRSRDEVADWRGIGPKALETLSGALEEADLSFSE